MEVQLKYIIGGAVGVQSPSHSPTANEAMLSTQDDDRPVDQLHKELLSLTR